MNHDYVGYQLGLLDPGEHRRTEEALRTDPTAREKLERLRQFLAPLEADSASESPPPGLTERTLAFVRNYAEKRGAGEQGSRGAGEQFIFSAPPLLRSSAPPLVVVPAGHNAPEFRPSRWRRADAVIAAGILVILGGLGLSGLGRAWHQHGIMACKNNLRELHQALVSYSDEHQGAFPQVSDQPPRNVAGAFVPMLQEAGLLRPTGAPNCPSFALLGPDGQAASSYAYSLGYRDAEGRLYGLRRDPRGTDAGTLPIMADRPNPLSHGTGFNVLFIGGHVRYSTSPRVGVGGDDIFVNQMSEIAAGLHRLDSVLGPSDTSP